MGGRAPSGDKWKMSEGLDSSKVTGGLASFLIAIISAVPFGLIFLFGDWTQVYLPIENAWLTMDLFFLCEFAAIIVSAIIIGALVGGYIGANSRSAGAGIGMIAGLVAWGFWCLSDLYYGIATITIDLAAPMTWLYLMVLATSVSVLAGIVYKVGQFARQ